MFSKAAIIVLIPALAAAQTCIDDATFSFDLNNGNNQDCKWLTKNWKQAPDRIATYCVVPAIKGACSNSCGSCPCADTSGFTFTLNNGNMQQCDWFTKRKTVIRRDDYCAESGRYYSLDIADGCIDSCGLCTGDNDGSSAPSTTPLTSAPTGVPTTPLTSAPTGAPVAPTKSPTSSPTTVQDGTPSTDPSRPPSPLPSPFPTLRPTNEPSDTPSEFPSDEPSMAPSTFPSDEPSMAPSNMPSDAPSQFPSDEPSVAPSNMPSDEPSMAPSNMPSDKPSRSPSDEPSVEPSGLPSDSPTTNPSSEPSITPTNNPTSSVKPSSRPSAAPIGTPTATTPSPVAATSAPSKAPVKSPTAAPVGSCADDATFMFDLNNGNTVGCDWLTKNSNKEAARKATYCNGAVLGNCLSSCDNCSCASDSTTFTFTLNNGNIQGCSWFAKTKTVIRRDDYCVESGQYYDEAIANTCVSGCFCGPIA